MNELLQKHGCSKVFHIPDGLKELMSDISREVLRAQPKKLLGFITNYLSVLMITREHGIMTVKILDDLCDCRPTVVDHLKGCGLDADQAADLSEIIHEEISGVEPDEGTEKVREIQIMKRILSKHPLDEEFSVKVIQVIRNAYRNYIYKKKIMSKAIYMKGDEPWQVAAANTLEIYKRTKPSMAELNRATLRIQAAYRGYHIRRKMLEHLKKPKPQPQQPQAAIGPPVDVAGSVEIDLGPVLRIDVKEDDVKKMFEEHPKPKPKITYDGPVMPFEEDDNSARNTLDIMSNRTDDNQTLSHYGIPITESKSEEDTGANGPRISFASKPLMYEMSTSETKDDFEFQKKIKNNPVVSPASTVVSERGPNPFAYTDTNPKYDDGTDVILQNEMVQTIPTMSALMQPFESTGMINYVDDDDDLDDDD